MIRRAFWFLLGVAAGVYSALWVRRTAEDVSERLTPAAVAEQTVRIVSALLRAMISGIGYLVEAATDRTKTGPSI